MICGKNSQFSQTDIKTAYSSYNYFHKLPLSLMCLLYFEPDDKRQKTKLFYATKMTKCCLKEGINFTVLD